MLLTQLKYDLKMFFRELFYLVFTVIMPPASYIFMGQLFGSQSYGKFNYAQFYTPSFIILITFSVVFFAFGFDNVMNRSSGIEKRISISPINMRIIVVSNILKSVIITSLGFLSILTLGIFVYDLKLAALQLLLSYGFFIIINITLLILSLACYSFFNEMKSALVFSIIAFQVVMFTGDFSVPVAQAPKFVQYIAHANPVYHLNHLFINIWNNAFEFNRGNLISIGYVAIVVLVSLIVFLLSSTRKKD
ncbi:ABC transporter permease [Hathewaya massiliensis]|uniref:ABC transporter permease n=1 Tax=Hathewaya massiliensis TaxID=1964382 RepID=UPI0011579C5B|nr:ABC transporter permease [Hathewaya massiliensis]